MRLPRAILFDFGGVLGLPQDPERVARLCALAGQPLPRFREAYRRRRLDLDRGSLSAEDYWRLVLEECGAFATPDLVAKLEREDTLSWTRVNDRMLRWSTELREAGFQTAILSNMPTAKLQFMRSDGQFAWIRDFDVVIFSCDFRVVKPEPEIYHLCLERLGASPSECLFLDDTQANLDGAAAIGIRGYLFRTTEQAAADLGGTWLPVRSLKEGRNG